MALGSTLPLTEKGTRGVSWGGGKGGRCVGLKTLTPSHASNCWRPNGLSTHAMGYKIKFEEVYV